MKKLGKALSALVLVPVLVSGCSTFGWSEKMSGESTQCAVAGAVVGGGAGAALGAGFGALIGVPVGLVMGDALCAKVKPTPPPAPAPAPEVMMTLHDVNFAFDSAKLNKSAYSHLDKAVKALTEHPAMTLRIEGYTDNIGPAAYNMKLSMRRAESVKRYLVAHGIAADRLVTVGHGMEEPIASNATRAGRAKNRRVELIVP